MLCLNLYLHQTFPTDLIFQTLWKSPCYNLFFHSIPRLDGEVCNTVISRCTQAIEASYQAKEPFNDPILLTVPPISTVHRSNKRNLVRSAARIDIHIDMFCLSKLLLSALSFIQVSPVELCITVRVSVKNRWTSTFILLYSSVNTQLQKKLFWLCVTGQIYSTSLFTLHPPLHSAKWFLCRLLKGKYI